MISTIRRSSKCLSSTRIKKFINQTTFDVTSHNCNEGIRRRITTVATNRRYVNTLSSVTIQSKENRPTPAIDMNKNLNYWDRKFDSSNTPSRFLSTVAGENTFALNTDHVHHITGNTANRRNIRSQTSHDDRDRRIVSSALLRHKRPFSSIGLLSNRPNNHYFYGSSYRYDYEFVSRNNMMLSFSTTSREKENKNTTSAAASKSSGAESTASISAKPTTLTTTPTTNPSQSTYSKPPTATTEGKPTTMKKIEDAIKSTFNMIINAVVTFFLKLPGWTWYYMTHPSELKQRLIELKDAAKKEAHHYWLGTKLLIADVRTARDLMKQTLQGTPLTRRERKQLLRTVSDLFRLIPFSMFVLIPLAEFALPFALRLFPNMLPSTFQDSLKAEENMKRELQTRIAMAQFFQETLHDLAKEQKKQAESKRKKFIEKESSEEKKEEAEEEVQTAKAMMDFVENARTGKEMPPDVIVKFATYFHDDLTLDNMPRMQLINMCKYMSIPPYGADSILRFQLRNRIRTLKEDDQRIIWEGIDSLTKMELREACQERGMRSTGLTKDAYKRSLQQWLDLSVNQKVPISLLIMSRTFYLRDEMERRSAAATDKGSVVGLADAISGLDKEIVNEVVLDVATADEKKSDPEVLALKLEVLEQQNELISEEKKEREKKAAAAAAKKKEQEEKEKKELEEKEAEEAMATTAIASASEGTDATEVSGAISSDTVEEKTLKDSMGEGTVKEAATIDKALEGELVEEKKAQEEIKKEEEEEADEETCLSSRELEAIEQMVSDDPVKSEREQLESIKAAMAAGESLEEEKEVGADKEGTVEEVSGHAEDAVTGKSPAQEELGAAPVTQGMTSEEADKFAEALISKMDEEAAKVVEESTKMSMDGQATEPSAGAGEVVQEEEAPLGEAEEEEMSAEDQRLDKSIKRLQSRVEKMVGRIEGQLSDIEGKIGDKFHLLDTDRDGILTREEMAHALQRVLKRELSFEEAMEIAEDMDENKDGVLTVAELAKWLVEQKITRYVEEGRETDADRLVAMVEEPDEVAGEDQSKGEKQSEITK